MGKLFSETIRKGRAESFGREELLASRDDRRARSSRKHACVRAPETSCGLELRRRVASFGNEEEQAAVVCGRRSFCESVTEMEEFVGRLSLGSRLPQYFTTAILTGAVVLAWCMFASVILNFKE